VEERLQKILARAGFSSRRGAEQLMLEGRVTRNGEIVKELGTRADLEKDDVRVDGVRVKAPKALVYLVLNKPRGVVSTRSDPERRQTVMDLVPHVAGLFPIGRLDVTTEGLILLTNDGAFAERVSHPRYEVPRVYHAKVHRVPDAETLERLRRGVRVESDFMAVDRARVIDADNNAWVELTLHEGKHHEVKRLLEAVGHPVSKLRRVAIGPVTSRGLEPGQFRALAPEEIEGLRRGKDPASGALGRLARRRPRSRPRPRPRPSGPTAAPRDSRTSTPRDSRTSAPRDSRTHTPRDAGASGHRPERRRAGTRGGRR
jgi:23S rRNA pseudouridine2605 synthase